MLARFSVRCAVVACLVAVSSCADDSPEGVGFTELEVIVASGASLIGGVEYTLVCQASPEDEELRFEGTFEVLDDAGLSQGTVEVFSAFLDLPPGPCVIQVRGRDHDSEVVCTREEPFAVLDSSPTRVILVLSCSGGSFPPDDPTVAFNICPDLFPVECSEFEQDSTSTSCELIFRDEDDTCDVGCDPQTCIPTENGISCTPGPDVGVSTTVSCDENALDCEGDAVLDESCTYRNGRDSFFVDCLASDEGILSDSTITCTVVTTDGDLDCDRIQTVEIECPSTGL